MKKSKKIFLTAIFYLICILMSVQNSQILHGAEKVEKEEKLIKNVIVNGIDVGGMNRAAALEILSQSFPMDDEIKFVSEAKTHARKLSDFGAGYDFAAAIDTILEEYKSDGIFGGIKRFIEGIKGIEVDAEYSYDVSRISAILEEINNEYYVIPKEPAMSRQNGKFVIIDEIPGSQIDTEHMHGEVIRLLDKICGGETEIKIVPVPTEYTAADFAESTDLLGSFATPFNSRIRSNRSKNMRIASERINNCLILPKETFSASNVLGSRTLENGYLESGMIINGNAATGVGGGICQNASTLYMALLLAEAEITERRNHSLMIDYMAPATDATLAEGLIDLKFCNNSQSPMLIESILTDTQLLVNVYGRETRSANRKITFEPRLISQIPAEPDEIIEDANLPAGEFRIVSPSIPGAKYELYKLIYEDGKLTGETLINKSTYKPSRGVVIFGVGNSDGGI
ncbi:MAG: VanW family protein [Defluviitaleaceae bacterium]|nr:VanW family protein [Defluviitaleaceae bacterium]